MGDKSNINKKEIKQVWWPDTETEQGRNIKSNDETHIEMSITYHGDFDEIWIVEYKVENGKLRESARHNPRYVETIIWK